MTPCPRPEVAALASALGLSETTASVLVRRGYSDPAHARAFLEADIPEHDPFLLGDMEAACAAIRTAIADGKPICVHGDYDVDGICATALAVTVLRELGGEVSWHLPSRFEEGYGLSGETLTRLAGEETGLVLTVDCGITAVEEVSHAKELGLDVVVTDHHDVPAELPAAVAIVNPHRPDCPYPFKQLAGAGVALKVAQALAERRLNPAARAQLEPALLQLAALGTVSDVMPLIGENRAIVRHGLHALNHRPTAGLSALIRNAALARPWIEAEDIAFRIGPRLNAAGRIADATTTQQLLATNSATEAEVLALELEALNDERRTLAGAALDDARDTIGVDSGSLPPALVVQSRYPAGVLGLVAVRLVEETGRAVAVLEKSDGMSRGSVRVPDGISAIEAVTACGDLLLRFGGHRGAAGFAIDASNVPAFAEQFVQAVARQPTVTLAVPDLVAECRLRPGTVTEGLLDLLAQVGPFGQGAPLPLFESAQLKVREARTVGERHLRLKLWGEHRLLTAIAFGAAHEPPPPLGSTIDLLYRLKPNVWQGQRRVDLEVVAWRPSEP